MVFIKFSDRENLRNGLNELAGNRCPITMLQGKGKTPETSIYIINGDYLHLLDASRIQYEAIPESHLKDELSAKGYTDYSRIRNPYLPEPVPKGYTEVRFHVEQEKLDTALRIIGMYNYKRLERAKTDLVINIGASDLEDIISVSFLLPIGEFELLLSDLAERKIAGYDKTHMVFRSKPDIDEIS